nr:sphingomyelin phosphodiesterase [Vibrio cholerae]
MKFKYSMFLLGLTISFSVFSNGNSTFPILMSYNIYMLDKKLTDTQQIKRANLLNKSDFFNNIDIISFNEVFDNDSSQIITDGLTKKGFSYFTPVLGRQIIGWDSTEGNWSDSIPEDGGV